MSRARKPFCHDCGSADCHVTGNDEVGYLWLCGPCEVLRNDPEAALTKHPPGLPGNWPRRGRPGKPQKEQLF